MCSCFIQTRVDGNALRCWVLWLRCHICWRSLVSPVLPGLTVILPSQSSSSIWPRKLFLSLEPFFLGLSHSPWPLLLCPPPSMLPFLCYLQWGHPHSPLYPLHLDDLVHLQPGHLSTSALDILWPLHLSNKSEPLCPAACCVLALMTPMGMHSQHVSFVLEYSTWVFLLPLLQVVRGKLVRKLLP